MALTKQDLERLGMENILNYPWSKEANGIDENESRNMEPSLANSGRIHDRENREKKLAQLELGEMPSFEDYFGMTKEEAQRRKTMHDRQLKLDRLKKWRKAKQF